MGLSNWHLHHIQATPHSNGEFEWGPHSASTPDPIYGGAAVFFSYRFLWFSYSFLIVFFCFLIVLNRRKQKKTKENPEKTQRKQKKTRRKQKKTGENPRKTEVRTCPSKRQEPPSAMALAASPLLYAKKDNSYRFPVLW
jgi:hypothetical protein